MPVGYKFLYWKFSDVHSGFEPTTPVTDLAQFGYEELAGTSGRTDNCVSAV